MKHQLNKICRNKIRNLYFAITNFLIEHNIITYINHEIPLIWFLLSFIFHNAINNNHKTMSINGDCNTSKISRKTGILSSSFLSQFSHRFCNPHPNSKIRKYLHRKCETLKNSFIFMMFAKRKLSTSGWIYPLRTMQKSCPISESLNPLNNAIWNSSSQNQINKKNVAGADVCC